MWFHNIPNDGMHQTETSSDFELIGFKVNLINGAVSNLVLLSNEQYIGYNIITVN